METIYIDVLVIINIYITYFLLLSTSGFLHQKIKTHRYVLAALLGGISSLVILLPPLHIVVTITIKAIICIGIVMVAFGTKEKLPKHIITFLLINFIYAGFMVGLWLFAAPLGMYYNNGYAYFDISLLTIVIATIISYFCIKLVRYILDTKISFDKTYTMQIVNKCKKITISAFPDSGNTATDFLTGLPLIVCNYDEIKEILPNCIVYYMENSVTNDDEHMKDLRLIPYKTIGNIGVIPAFKPTSITFDDNKNTKNINALIGVVRKENLTALFNPKLLI